VRYRTLCVRNRTDGDAPKGQPAGIMESSPPVEVFYVVQSMGVLGERDHRLRSDLYETRPQAETELVRLQATDAAGSYGVWKSVTYIEPAEWRHRVVRSDGSLILPRLNGVNRFTTPQAAASER
jgi:hypothetical protein